MGRVSFGGQHPTSFALGRERGFTHQPGHSFARSIAPLILQLTMNAWAAISASMGSVNLPNLLCELSIFSCAPAGRPLAPGIQATFRDSKHVAHDHDREFLLVLVDKLIFHLESREKMLTTSDRISLNHLIFC